MAWWPFGKKKGPGEEGTTPSSEAEDGRTIAVPPPGTDAPAPTLLVPPEFSQPQTPAGFPASADMPTLEPQALNDPFSADPFAARPSAEQDFSKTLEDPDSPKVAAKKPPGPAPRGPAQPQPQAAWGDSPAPQDPFAPPPGGIDLTKTMEDDGEGVTIAPGHSPLPLGARGGRPQAAPMAAPADEFASAAPHEQTIRMPAPPVPSRGGPAPAPFSPPQPAADEYLTFTAPAPTSPAPPPMAPPPPPPASEETPMLAKTAALSPEKRRLGLALLAGGPITQERLTEELEKSGKGQSVLGKALLKSNFPREEEILAALVATIRIPKINVRNTKIPLETIKILPSDVAKRYHVLPIEKIGDILVVVSPGVPEEESLGAVRKATGCSVFPFQCDTEGFDEVLATYYDRLGSSGITPAIPAGPEPAAPPSPRPAQPQPAPVAAANGPLAALPANDGSDEWERAYAQAGPVPAEEALL